MINLHQIFAKHIPKIFGKESLIAGKLCTDYKFTGGDTVIITIPQTVALNDYSRSGANRYGTPQEVQDTKQSMKLRKDRSFSMTVDAGNLQEQSNLKKTGAMLRLQIRKRCVPESDAYIFAELAKKAGFIFGSSEALTKANICDRISAGTERLDDKEVDSTDRVLYIKPSGYNLLKHSDDFEKVPVIAQKALRKGVVGLYDNMQVVKVPSSRWPANVNFLIVQKDAACAPETINQTRAHDNPPGINGVLMEGRFRYDCFVLEATCDGVYADVFTGTGGGTVLAAPTVAAATGAITVASGATAKYTVDGSDPRYSDSAKVGTAPEGLTAGCTVKAYQYKTSSFDSAVTEVKYTGS